LDQLGDVYLNIFSCKEFAPAIAKEVSMLFFRAEVCRDIFISRG